jgi:uncharacterized protein YpmS
VSEKKPLTVWKIARWVILFILVVVVVQLLRKPAPLVEQPPDPQTRAQLAQQFQEKLGKLQDARERGETGAQIELSSEEVNAAMVEAPPPTPALPEGQEVPTAQNAEVIFEGDEVRGQFTTQLYGKDVVVTLSAKIGAQDGYLTIQPTQFKVGQLSLPISLVESVVQKKLSEPETREKLKLPDWVADVYVENGHLVVKEK